MSKLTWPKWHDSIFYMHPNGNFYYIFYSQFFFILMCEALNVVHHKDKIVPIYFYIP
jgi:hypothetical protein